MASIQPDMLCASDGEWVEHSLWCAQVAEQEFEYVGCTCGALKHEMLERRMRLDAARYRKLCGLMAYGECVIETPDEAGEYWPIDYSHELSEWIDSESQLKADCGHRAEAAVLQRSE